MTSKLKRKVLFGLCACALVVFMVHPALALKDIMIGGNPLTFMGYINQGVGYGLGDDNYSSMEEFQSFYFDFLLEAKYNLNPNMRIFVSGMLSSDWAYDILGDDSDWSDKGFGASRHRLAVDTDFRDLLQEAHITWDVGNFSTRIGKQIVKWGQTDSIRLMDQINPVDQRRGITDVEFESSILPIWLAKFEYFFQPDSAWLQDLGFEFIFNPNADFVADQEIMFGNDASGIWSPDVEVPIGPGMFAHLGSFDTVLDDPDDWDSDYYEYALRIKAVINDMFLTLNYFYGIDNIPVLLPVPAPPRVTLNGFDNKPVIHPAYTGKFHRFRLIGGTFTRDFENLNISMLGGVGPVLRLEAFYGFDNTFAGMPGGIPGTEEHDEFRYAIGVDWKIKVNWLNPRAYFMISPQFSHRKVLDYPSGYELNQDSTTKPVREDTYQSTLLINTSYFHNKLVPQFVWVNNWTTEEEGRFYILQLKYEHSSSLNFTLGTVFFNGDVPTQGFEPFDEKDHAYFTVRYKF